MRALFWFWDLWLDWCRTILYYSTVAHRVTRREGNVLHVDFGGNDRQRAHG